MQNPDCFYQRAGQQGCRRAAGEQSIAERRATGQAAQRDGTAHRTALDGAVANMVLHDFFWLSTDVPGVLKDLHAALKPGGWFGVVDHSAPPGTGARDAMDRDKGTSSHRRGVREEDLRGRRFRARRRATMPCAIRRTIAPSRSSPRTCAASKRIASCSDSSRSNHDHHTMRHAIATLPVLVLFAVAALGATDSRRPFNVDDINDDPRRRLIRSFRPTASGSLTPCARPMRSRTSASRMCGWRAGTASSSVQLTNSESSEHTPRWSPDGKYLSFLTSRGEDERPGAGVAARSPRRRSEAAHRASTAPSSIYEWSPDGKRLALIVTDEDPHRVRKGRGGQDAAADRHRPLLLQGGRDRVPRRAAPSISICSTSRRARPRCSRPGDSTKAGRRGRPTAAQIAFVSNRSERCRTAATSSAST